MIKENIIKVCILLLSVVLISGSLYAQGGSALPIAIGVGAQDSIGYNMTDSYKSGKYYDNLRALDLSGDQARDVLAIAMSQVGYHEGNADGEFSGLSSAGTRDFVEYNVLYGRLDNNQGNGMSYGYYWCASFVNWCLRLAGVWESASGSEVSCQRWYADCRQRGIFRSRGGYIPSSADIIFFKDNGSSADSTHVGLVRYSDGEYVYTVEGNTSNGSDYSSNGEYVALKKYPLSSGYIVGYATPKYNDNTTSRRVDYSGGFLSLGQYISEEEIKVYTDNALKTDSGNKIPVHTVFSVTEIGDAALKVSLDGKEGYISADTGAIQLTTSESVYTVNYVNENGSMMYLPQYRRAGEQKYAYKNTPKREDSGFVGWKMKDGSAMFSPGDKLPNSNSDMTFVAVFDSNYYVVSFTNQDGTLIYQAHGYYGTKFDFPEAPEAPEGYVFSGWDTNSEGVITGDASYTVTFVAEDELQGAVAGTDADAGNTDKAGCVSSASLLPLLITAPIAAIPVFFRRRKCGCND